MSRRGEGMSAISGGSLALALLAGGDLAGVVVVGDRGSGRTCAKLAIDSLHNSKDMAAYKAMVEVLALAGDHIPFATRLRFAQQWVLVRVTVLDGDNGHGESVLLVLADRQLVTGRVAATKDGLVCRSTLWSRLPWLPSSIEPLGRLQLGPKVQVPDAKYPSIGLQIRRVLAPLSAPPPSPSLSSAFSISIIIASIIISSSSPSSAS